VFGAVRADDAPLANFVPGTAHCATTRSWGMRRSRVALAHTSQILGNPIASTATLVSTNHMQGIVAALAAPAGSTSPTMIGARQTVSTAPLDNTKAAAAAAAALIAARDSFRVRTRVAGPAATRALRASTKAAMGAVVAPLAPGASTKAALGAVVASLAALDNIKARPRLATSTATRAQLGNTNHLVDRAIAMIAPVGGTQTRATPAALPLRRLHRRLHRYLVGGRARGPPARRG
jgi:hypothetical protein